MSSTMTATRSPSISLKQTDKANKPSKVIILRLSPNLMARFEEKPHEQPPEPQPQQEESSHVSPAPSPTPITTTAPIVKVDSASESNSTPAPPTDAPTDGDPPKKRKGPAPGTKRTIALTVDGIPKPRGKPGPKKKPRLEDGTIDHTNNKPTATGGANPKLGPKMNAGTINANLRALDRSGKPCRKWTPKPFFVKSFTGVSWEAPSWKGNEKAAYLNGDDSSETKDISMQSSSEIRPDESDTAMNSNAGEAHDPMALSTPAASSPPPIPAQPAIAA